MAKDKQTKKTGSKAGAAKQKEIRIGATVRKYRCSRKLTTTELAKKVGISQAQVSRLENGQQGFRSSVIVRIAEALGVPVWALFMSDEERKSAKRKRMLKG